MGSTFTEVSAAKFLPIMGFFERFFWLLRKGTTWCLASPY
jgi:hypothetical protein